MSASSRQKRLSLAYKRFREGLITILYEEDPGRMGSSVGAPPDEYAQEASVLAARLTDADTGEQDVRLTLQEMFRDDASDELVSRVERALGEFARQAADTGHSG